MYFLLAYNKTLNKSWIIRGLLILILLVALGIRLFAIDQLRLTQDEMSIGYNAFAIATTGADEWGVSFPLAFKAFGDWKLPGYIYAVVPFVKLWGLSNLTVKLPSILAGLFTVWGLFELTKKLTKSPELGLVAGLIAALSPWSIHLSRMGFESNLALSFFIWGNIFFFNLLKYKKRWWLWALLTGLLWSLTFYTYVAFRLVMVLYWLGILALSWIYKINYKKVALVLVSFVIFLLPLMPYLLGKSGTARFAQVSIFTDDGVVAQIDQRRSYCYLVEPKVLPRVCALVFNKPQVYMERFVRNYAQFILPSFLFLNGDSLEYLNDPGFGEFMWVLLPFYLLGLTYWLKKEDLASNLIKWGFLIAPIPSALVGDPQIVRGSALLPFVIIFTTYGLKESWELVKNNMARWLYGFVIGGLFIFLTANYLVHYLFIYPREYQAYFFPIGAEVGEYLLEQYDSYDQIYISDNFADTHILIAFLAKYDLTWYKDNIVLPEADKFGFQHPTRLGKFTFGNNNGQTLLCDPTIENMLYMGGATEEIPFTQDFKGFSGVHTQVRLMDLDLARENLTESKKMEEWCGE